jgi:hypothetical protein
MSANDAYSEEDEYAGERSQGELEAGRSVVRSGARADDHGDSPEPGSEGERVPPP